MIESKSLDRLNKDLNEIGADLIKVANEIPEQITKRLTLGAISIRNTIIDLMTHTPKTGRIYKKGKGGRFHIASSPGNAPAVDSGALRGSLIFDVRNLEVEVGSIIGNKKGNYPLYLEEGTKKMEARPWLAPAVKEHEKEILDDVGGSVFEILQKPFEGK